MSEFVKEVVDRENVQEPAKSNITTRHSSATGHKQFITKVAYIL